MPTYTDQLAALTAFTDGIINTNGVGAITGAVHNDNESAQNVSSFANLVAYDNYAYKVVRTYATDAANGDSLRDAYTDAATFVGLSATNRFALLLPPGTYALGSTGLTMGTQFVDLIGLGRADETIITSVSNTNGGNGTIIQTTNDIKFRNLTIQNDAAAYSTGTDTDDSGYAPQGVYPSTEFTDCIFRNPGTGGDGAPFMRLGVEYGGTYQRCRGIDAGSGISVFFAIASGNYFDCHTSVNGFGYLGEASGVFTDSSCFDGFGFGADASGSFTRCTAFNSGFGSGGNASGTFNLCTALTNSFGWGNAFTCSGTFIGCKATEYSFGDSALGSQFIDCRSGLISFGNFFEMAGTYTNCIGGAGSFGSQSLVSFMTGNFTNCVVDGGSGFGSDSTVISGNLTDCLVNGQAGFNGALLSGNFTNCHVYGPDGFTPFTPGGELSGTFKNCSAGERSFGYSANISAPVIISGEFYNCQAGNNSFGCTVGDDSNISFTGKAYNCNAGNYSFCTTIASPNAGTHTEVMSGYLENCHAGPGSFAAAPTATKTGTLSGCTVRAVGLTPSVTDAGVLTGTMINCQWTSSPAGDPALLVATGAKVYGGLYRAGSGATASITSTGAATVSIANVLVNQNLGGGITNNITAPNVIVDTNI
jgi:hypothetical protein